MKKIVLALIVVTALATGIAYSISRKSSTSTFITDASPLGTYVRQGKGIRERISAPRKDSGRVVTARMHSSAVLAQDQRMIALSPAEAEWLRKHYYPSKTELENLDSLDMDALRGTRDPMSATLLGLAAIARGNTPGSSGILQNAATMGSIYAYEESAIAEYQLTLQRLGPAARASAEDSLRAKIEVAKILGDHRAGTLLGKYIPDYNDNSSAGIVQQYTTEYLRQLGNNAQLLGAPPPGPDPRPNLEQWNDLEKLQQAGTSEMVDVYSVRP